jgi:hypothetical protein
MISKKVEMVSAALGCRICSQSLIIFSIQHSDGFRLCPIPVDDHVETGHEEVGETWALCGHVFGMLPSLLAVQNEQDLTLALGCGHRSLDSDPDTLEIPRQQKRRIVLLAPRHVSHLVLLRSCRHYHCAMRPGAARTGRRRPLDTPFNTPVKAASIHRGLRDGEGRSAMVPCEMRISGSYWWCKRNGVSEGLVP